MATTKAPAPTDEDEIQSPVVGSWDEIEEKEPLGDFETLPNGTFDFYLADAEKRIGETSGNEYVAITLCHEKEPQEDEPEGTQHKFYCWENLHFTTKTVGVSKRALRLMGVDLSVMRSMPFESGVVPDELIEAIEDAKDTGVFPVRVKRTRYKNASDEVRYKNEVVRFIEN